MPLRIWIRPWRKRQERQRRIEDGLRRLGESLEAPEQSKRAGLDRLLAEFERARGRSP